MLIKDVDVYGVEIVILRWYNDVPFNLKDRVLKLTFIQDSDVVVENVGEGLQRLVPNHHR